MLIEINIRPLMKASLMTIGGILNDASAAQLDQAFQSLLQQGVHKLIVDMSGLEELYSAGFLSLVMAQRGCQEQGGELLLVNVPEHIRYVLGVTGLASYIRTVDLASLPDLSA